MKFPVAPQSTRVVVATVLAPYCRQMGKWIALLDLFATSTDTRTKEEDVATSSFSKKTLHLFRQLPQLAGHNNSVGFLPFPSNSFTYFLKSTP